jgi:hypothetical protein
MIMIIFDGIMGIMIFSIGLICLFVYQFTGQGNFKFIIKCYVLRNRLQKKRLI